MGRKAWSLRKQKDEHLIESSMRIGKYKSTITVAVAWLALTSTPASDKSVPALAAKTVVFLAFLIPCKLEAMNFLRYEVHSSKLNIRVHFSMHFLLVWCSFVPALISCQIARIVIFGTIGSGRPSRFPFTRNDPRPSLTWYTISHVPLILFFFCFFKSSNKSIHHCAIISRPEVAHRTIWRLRQQHGFQSQCHYRYWPRRFHLLHR